LNFHSKQSFTACGGAPFTQGSLGKKQKSTQNNPSVSFADISLYAGGALEKIKNRRRLQRSK
jgi:hypothetical protein